ncbi:hypothetical protein O1611_g2271 [Lasiodiplodia mahajangana]|uniref:Uncharacterized protein n=1 Tax=Lasiodiplodia mahajangana TaxID=1108764 RepID=A0ACC2JV52_9PEZI|nr:hypothetical protein O1611_g2271 [Lasiodiplodia mahajangana]
MSEISKNEPISPAPPPWKLKGTVYILSFWNSKTLPTEGPGGDKIQGPPAIAYSPLEAKSSFADPTVSGEYLGGLSQIMVIRYTESPVGPYDELVVCSGFFACEKDDGEVKKRFKNQRVTRIYVSQKNTCWNGRNNWNIPKHLARFEWEGLPGGKTRVRVYPYDTAVPSGSNDGAVSESSPSEKYFFQAAFQPMRWAPYFPLSLSWLKYVGIDASLVQPPLPDGRQDAGEELIGTSRWCKIPPAIQTRKAMLGWMDMAQQVDHAVDGNDSSGGGSDAQYENFWPGLRRWNVAIKMENADIGFGDGVYWDATGT